MRRWRATIGAGVATGFCQRPQQCGAVPRSLIGDYERGWREHEWRWQTDQLADESQLSASRCGSAQVELAGKTILPARRTGLWRHVPILPLRPAGRRQRGARVVLEVQRPLQP